MANRARPDPVAGMIANCLFPHEEDVSKPGPIARPALVVAVMRSGKVVVAYGSGQNTSVQNKPLLQHQIEVGPDTEGYASAGLAELTRFDFLKCIPMEWNSKWFAPYKGAEVKRGWLPRAVRNAVAAARQAAANIVAQDPDRAWGVEAQRVLSAAPTIRNAAQTADQPTGENRSAPAAAGALSGDSEASASQTSV